MRKAYSIIHEDEYLLVVNKEAGIPVIPGRTSEMARSLKYMFKEKFGDIFIVHRIDSDTSGLVILAKDADTHRSLNTMFMNRKVEKTYMAITRGLPRPSQGEISAPLKKLNNQNKSIISKEGKAALTNYTLQEQFGNIGLVEAEILTGRHHQIRVHLASVNAPLLVDPTYGDQSFMLSEIKGKKYKRGRLDEERPLLSRLSLHAHRLSFIHPVTGLEVRSEAAIPKDLRATLNQLRKSL